MRIWVPPTATAPATVACRSSVRRVSSQLASIAGDYRSPRPPGGAISWKTESGPYLRPSSAWGLPRAGALTDLHPRDRACDHQSLDLRRALEDRVDLGV